MINWCHFGQNFVDISLGFSLIVWFNFSDSVINFTTIVYQHQQRRQIKIFIIYIPIRWIWRVVSGLAKPDRLCVLQPCSDSHQFGRQPFWHICLARYSFWWRKKGNTFVVFRIISCQQRNCLQDLHPILPGFFPLMFLFTSSLFIRNVQSQCKVMNL